MDGRHGIAAPRGRFPPTSVSMLIALGEAEPEARRGSFARFAAGYWKPVFSYVRFRWKTSDDEAEDIAQAFFAIAFEKRFFGSFDPAKARFRTYLRVCVDRFVAKWRRGVRPSFVDFDAVPEAELAAPADDYEAYFDKAWKRHVV